MERQQTPQCMESAVPSQIESLFLRNPSLCGFSVVGVDDVPDNVPRTGDEELFVGDLGTSPALGAEQFRAIFQEIIDALADLIAEYPELSESLRGRTFARSLH